MLESLKIKNFRALEDFEVTKLGRVNLIVGKNNSGKSTVLEALQIYAGNAQESILNRISASREEETNLKTILPYQDFFTGRVFPDNLTAIEIGPIELLRSKEEEGNQDKTHCLTIEHGLLEDNMLASATHQPIRLTSPRDQAFNTSITNPRPVIQVSKNNNIFSIIYLDIVALTNRTIISKVNFETTPCGIIPTQLLTPDELATAWDSMDEIDDENIVKQAMKIITPEFESLKFVGNSGNQRNAKVKLTSLPRYVPLKSLGDGMLRILQLSLKLVSAKGGFLLIDEFENGLHYSIQDKVWALLFEMAEKLNIQVFATTHSWDCIESFARAANNRKEVAAVLFRIGKSARKSNSGQVIATVMDGETLYNITQSDVEVR